MALRGDRNIGQQSDISYFMNETAERGCIVVHDTGGSGAAMDDANAVVKLPDVAYGSGENPAGLLLSDMVNNDQTRTHTNWHKDETQLGGKVPVLRRGTIVTNRIDSTVTPTIGAKATFTTNGLFHTIAPGTSGATQVGRYLSTKDSDGYAKIEINIV